MKGANDTIILIVWVAATIFSLVSSMNICGKTDETILISYNKSTSVDTIPWRLNGNPFYTSSFETDGLTCITTPPPPADYEVLCSNVKFSGFNYFGLKILKPQDGDYYYTTDPNDKRTIIVPEPATMTVDITSTITTDTVLPSTDTISMECQISNCTKPQPNIMWQYITVGGTGIPISNTYINSTLDATGCTGTLTKINSKVEIFRDSVPITDVPFQVICVLSYDLCPGNTFNETTDYTITITDATSSSIPTSPTVITSTTSLTSQTPITSQTSLSSQTPVTSQIPITSQSPITSKTPLTSLTPVTLQSPKTSKAPVTSQSPVTSQTSTSDLPTNNGSDSVKDTLIIIIVFSGIAGVIVIVIVVCCCCFLIRHYRSKKRRKATDNTYDNNSSQFHGRIQPPFKTTDSVSVQTSSKPESRRHISSKQQISTHHARGQVSSKDDSRKDAHHKRSKLYPELTSHARYSPYYSQASSSGYYSQAPASGYYKTAPSSGYYSQAPASGYYTQPRSSASNHPRYQSGGYRGDQQRHQQFDGFMFY